MDFSQSEVQQLAADVWASALGLEVHPSGRRVTRGTPDFLTACVQITGAWQGAVVLLCSKELARRAATIMFGVGPQTVTIEHTHDALGELTNMIGGNIKALLPQPAYLSMPALADRADYLLSGLDSQPLVQT